MALLAQEQLRSLQLGQGQLHPEYLAQPLVIERFEQAAAQYPHMPCVVFEDQEMTYAAVDAAAEGLAQHLTAAGVGPGCAVGVMLPRSFELVVSIVAIWKAGCVYVPMDPDYPQARLSLYLQDSKATAVLVQPSQESAAQLIINNSGGGAVVLSLNGVKLALSSASREHAVESVNASGRVQDSDIAYCIFTSGSTGRPKGVQVSHSALRDLLAHYTSEFKAGPGMRTLQVVSISFDPHVLDITATITSGGCLVLPRPGGHMDPDYIAGLIRKETVTHILSSVPSLSAHYLSALRGWDGLRFWVFCGEPLPPSLVQEMHKVLPSALGYNAYGPTEATVYATSHCCPRPLEGSMVIGTPDHNMHCYVVDPASLALQPPGVAGELLLSGPRLAAGYVGQQDLTAKAFVPNPFFASVATDMPSALRPYYQRAYRTGDLVRWTSAGQLQFLGRIDRQVKVNGVRIELGEVEAALAGGPGVQGAVSRVVKDANGRSSLVGYCLVADDAVAAVQSHCKRVLLPAMVPSVIVALSEFPRLPNGKVDVAGLPEPDWAALAAGEAYQAPSSKVEAELQALWMEELKLSDPISVTADWYQLGGTSLKAIGLSAAIKQHFNLSGPSGNLILLTTIRDMAACVQQQLPSSSKLPKEPVDSSIPVNSWPDELRPVSSGQSQMYVLCNEGSNRHYNETSLYGFAGNLCITTLQRAADAITERHEVLRGGYEATSAGLQIRIASSVTVPFEVCDISSLPLQQAEDKATQLMRACRNEPFDLAVPPLMRAMLVKMPPEHDAVSGADVPVWKLLLVLHHAVMDGWSMGVLTTELSNMYQRLRAGQCSSLAPLPLQYSDWAAWQSSFLATAEAHQQLQWWKETLAGVPELLTLPTDRPRPPVQSFRGASYDFELPQSVAAAIAALNAATGSSMYNTCLTAYKVVLSLYSGQQDIVVGSAHASRPKGTEGLIGYLVNTVAVRTCIDHDVSIRQLLINERAALLNALAHASIPFADVVSASTTPRSSAYNPLVQAMMTTVDLDWLPELCLEGCRPKTCSALPTDSTKSDLVLTIYPRQADVLVSLQYSTDLFDRSTIASMCETFIAVLDAAASAPDVPLAQSNMFVGGKQRQKLLVDLQAEYHPEYLDTPLIHKHVAASAKSHLNKPCLVHENASMTYQEVESSTNALAAQLLDSGIRQGACIGIMLTKGLHTPIAMLAVLKVGGTYVPLDPYYPQERLTYYACAAGVPCIMAEPLTAERAHDIAVAAAVHLNTATAAVSCGFADSTIPVLEFTQEAAISTGALKALAPAVEADPSTTAFIIFTSGSTGNPKGVAVSHRGLADFVQDWVARCKLSATDVGMLSSTISFDAHALQLWPLLVAGGKCVVPRDDGHMDPRYIADLMAAHGVTVNLFVTPQLGMEWLKNPAMKQNAGTVRLWVAGGELVPQTMLEKVYQVLSHSASNLVVYGPTETSVIISTYSVSPDAPQGLLGRPTANTHLYVVVPGQPQSLMPFGAPGELLISGPGLALGYINDPDKTKQAFIDNPFYLEVSKVVPSALRPYYQRAYRTGDLVRWTSAGQLQFLGRIDRQVKVNGVRIELGEVEAALAGGPGVQGAVARVVKDANGRSSLVGYCLVADDAVAAVQSHCKRVLLPAMVPSVIVALSEFPRLPNGKVDVAGLPEPDWAALAAGEAYQAPSSKVEAELQALWMEELKICEPISVAADWYMLGGTSLKAIAISAAIKQLYNLSGPASRLIVLTTIREQAVYVQQQIETGQQTKADSHSSSITAITWPDELRPPSAGQAQMYVLSMEGDNSHYNSSSMHRIVGHLELDVLQRVLNAIADKHEVLRGVFEATSAGLQIRIASSVTVPFEVCDVSSLPSQQAEDKATELMKACRNEPFNLAVPPLMRAMLVKMPPEHDAVSGVNDPVWKLLLVLHHAVMDGWSMGVLVRELNTLYREMLAGQRSSLAPLPLQYSDWAAWQSSFLASAEAHQQLQWWKETLTGVPELLTLPTDRPRPPVQSFRGASYDFEIPRDVAAAVAALNAVTGSSMYNTCLTAYKVVLSLYSGQQDIVVGSAHSLRTSGTEHIIGYMVNTLPVRTFMDPQTSFLQLLAAERAALLDAMSHAGIPFADVVSVLGVKHSSAYTPLVQAMMTTGDSDWFLDLALPDCRAGCYESLQEERTFSDIALAVYPRSATTSISITYSTDLFSQETIKAMAQCFTAVLASAAAAPNTPLEQLTQVLSEEQQFQLLGTMQGQLHPEYLDQPLVVEGFEQAAAQYSQMPCVVFEDQEMTYAAVNAAANALVRHLAALGAGPGCAVGVMLPRSFDLVVSIVAVWKAGCVYVPMDPDYPEDRLAVYAQDSKASLVLVQPSHESTARSLVSNSAPAAEIVVLNDLALSAIDDSSNLARGVGSRAQLRASDIAYCIFTSGSTGRPKGVQVSHGALRDLLAQYVPEYKAGPGMRTLQVVSISFDPHLLDITATITSGGCLVLPRPGGHMDPDYIAGLIRKERVTHVLTSVPSMSAHYLTALGTYNGLLLWLMGGEQLSAELASRMQQALPNLTGPYNAYGPTEATICATHFRCPRPLEGSMVIGAPDHNMHCYVVDPASLALLPPGVAGELLLSGPRLAAGYVGRQDLTAKAFVPNPFFASVATDMPSALRPYYQRAYRTGDLVRWTSAGQLQFLGRIDRQVKVNGVRIELGEVEAALAGGPGVQGAVSRVVKDANGRSSLVGYCLVADDAVAAVQSHCKRVLLPAMVPSVIVALSEFPRLPNGKVDVAGLPEPDWAALAAGEAYQAPSSKVEAELQALWMEELKIHDPISVKADWYRLGGTSLKAVALAAAIKQLYNLSGPASDLIMLTSIAEQAKHVQQHSSEAFDASTSCSPVLMARNWQDDLRPPSAGQAQMYVLSMDGDNSHYNESSMYTIVGHFDADIMQQALAGIIDRHEVLRGGFEATSAGLQIRIASSVTVPLEVCDVSSLPSQQAEDKAVKLMRTCRNHPFDLAVPPLMRAMLVKMPPEHDAVNGADDPVWKLLLVLHHAVMDGWSMGVLVRELDAMYRNMALHNPPSLPPLSLQYSDWAAWQSSFLASAEAHQQLQWWKETLAGVPELLALPTDRPRPPVQSFRGASYDFELPQNVAAAVAALNAATGSSMYNTCLTAYKVVLSLYSGQQDIVVGSTYALRPKGTEDLIGYLVNVIPVRSFISMQAGFQQLLEAERATLLGAIAHAAIPFADIVSALGMKRSRAYTPLVQASMTTDEAGWFPTLTLPGCRPAIFQDLDSDRSKSDIVLCVIPDGDKVSVLFEYNTDLFDNATIVAMAETFTAVLAAAAAAPDTPLGQLTCLTGELQRQRLLQGLQGELHPEYLDQPLVVECFEQAASQYPHMPCVVFEDQEMTYAAVNAAANALAHHLAALGAGPGCAVGVMLPRSFDLVVSIVAVWKAGCVYVPMDPDYPEDRLAVYAQDSHAAFILLHSTVSSKAANIVAHCSEPVQLLLVDTLSCQSADFSSKTTGSDAAYCIFTSGSTGRPKGVHVLHQSLAGATTHAHKIFEAGLGMRTLQVVSISFDPHVLDITATLTSGGCLVLPRPGGHMDPGYIAALIRRERVTHVLACVASLSREYATALGSYNYMRLWVMGGELWPADLAEKMQETLPKALLINAYGPTEATVAATYYPVPRPCVSPIVIGSPVDNMHAYVVEPEWGCLLPIGAPGELLLSGPALAAGYIGRQELTDAAFRPNPFFIEISSYMPSALRPYYQRAYRTGDLVRWTSAGQLQFLGRIDRQVKVNGVRIELGEVEAALAGGSGVQGAVARVVKDANGRSSLVGYCLVSDDAVAAVQSHCKRVLLPAMVPSVIVALSEFPRLPNGKVDVAGLPEPDWAALAAGEAYQAPSSKVEAELQALWMEELKIHDSISVKADWYRLGGTSLKAVALSAAIKQLYNLSGPASDLIMLTSIAEQAQHVQQHLSEALDPSTSCSPVLMARSWPDDLRPPSAGQAQMYVLSMEGDNSHYNESSMYTIVGHFDGGIMQQALAGITDRHEVLRGGFEATSTGLQMRIASSVSVPLEVCDVSSLPPQQAEERAMELMRACKSQPFDLAVPPLMRAMLVKMPPEHDAVSGADVPVWKLLLVLHHAVMDGWSMGVITRELNLLYPDMLAGKQPSLPALPLQYSDWAAWQSQFLACAEAQQQLRWWKETLEGVPELLDLPTERPRPPVQSFRGASFEFTLPDDIAAAVAALNAATGSSTFNTFLTAYKVVLSLYSGQQDIVVGTPSASRPKGTTDLIGYLVNVIAVRSQVDQECSFEHLLANERQVLLGAMAHADVPFARLVSALGIRRCSAYSPLIQVMMTTTDEDWALELVLPGCKPAQPRALHTNDAKSDLVLGLCHSAATIKLAFQYNTDLFDCNTIKDMSKTLVDLIAAAAAAPHMPLQQLVGLVGMVQQNKLLVDCQGQYHPEYLEAPLLHKHVTKSASAQPSKACLVFNDASMTYEEVESSANALATQLLDSGIQPGARVGVLLSRGLHMPIAMLAVLKAGGTYVPLDPYYPQERLAYYASAARVSCILAEPLTAERAHGMAGAAAAHSSASAAAVSCSTAASKVHVLEFTQEAAMYSGALKVPAPAVEVDPSTTAFIIFTSGSTGNPKGVAVNHRGLADFVQDWVARCKLSPEDIGILTSSISFDAHALQLWALLVAGGKCVVPRDDGHMDPRYIADLMAAHGVTVNLFVTPQLGMEWLKNPAMKQNAGTVRLWVVGGELVPQTMLEKVYQVLSFRTSTLVIYGPTETSVIVSSYNVSPDAPQGLLGRPNANTHFYVVFPGQPQSLMPFGAPGELLISGPGLALGYINDPDKTKKAFIDNPFYSEVCKVVPTALRPYYQRAYRTGDLVRWTSAGQLQFLGRIDRQVKVNGVRIELGEVEAALLQCAGVTGAVATGRVAESGIKSLVAFVTPASVDTVQAAASCRTHLVPAMVPSLIVAVDQFPLLPNNKVNVTVLLASLKNATTAHGQGLHRGPGPNTTPSPFALREQASIEPMKSVFEVKASGYAGPEDDIEAAIQNIWETYLQSSNEHISVEANFWHLGGTSLQAGLITSEIKRALGVNLQLVAFNENSTIRLLAAHVKQQVNQSPKRGFASLHSWASLKEQPPTLRQVLVRSRVRARGYFNFPARTTERLREKLYVIGIPSWSFTFYACVQFLLSTFMWFVVPGCFAVTSLGLISLLAKLKEAQFLHVLPLLMAVYPAALLLLTFVLILLKWFLFGRLSPGAYPVHSWTYAKWVTMQALQQHIFPLLSPFIAQTAAARWLLRALGVRVGSNVLLESFDVFDWDLVEIAEGATLEKGSSIRASFVVPADPGSGRVAVLVLSWTSIGKDCKLGMRSSVPAGTHLGAGRSLSPAMTAGQEGAVKEGGLAEMPHFLPERHQSRLASLLACLLVIVLQSFTVAIGIGAGLSIALLAAGIMPTTVNQGSIFLAALQAPPQYALAFCVVVTVSSFKVVACVMACLTFIITLLWKRLILGSLRPGTCVLSSKGKLWSYSVWRRLLMLPGNNVWTMMFGNTSVGAVGLRLLGAKLGRSTFYAGLECSEPDALELGDYMSSGGQSHASCVDEGGVVHSVVVEKGVTLGNISLLYPGCRLGKHCIIGSNTAITYGERVAPHSRRQGNSQFGNVMLQESLSQTFMEEGRQQIDKEVGSTAFSAQQAAAPKRSHRASPYLRATAVFFMKYLLLNTQVEVQSFLLLLVWFGASLGLNSFYLGMAFIPPVLLFAVMASAVWCRLLSHVLGCRSLWLKASATQSAPSTHSVWSLRASMSTDVLAPMQMAIATPYLGTPMLNMFLRLMGMKVGQGVIFLGAVPAEAPLFTLDDNVVIEPGSMTMGHFLAAQRFTYLPVRLGKCAWIQSSTTLQAGCTMEAGARIMPGANVLPGFSLHAGSTWDGIPAYCMLESSSRSLEVTRSALKDASSYIPV